MDLKPQRKSIQFLNRGIQTSRPVNRLAEAKFLRLVNVRSYIDGLVQTRSGVTVGSSNATATPLHSLRRLNVTAPGAPQAQTLIAGGGTSLYTTDGLLDAFTLRDTGYSGNYLSFVPHRPTQSPEPWMYVADANKMRKVRVNGTNYQMGIAPPTVAPNAFIGAPIRTTISDFEAAGAWTNGGDAGAIAVASRLTGITTITRILFDSGTTGLASVQPSVLDDNVQAGMFLIVDAAGTPETVVIEKVFRSIVNTTIARIVYDSGNTGLCTIQLTAPVSFLEKDAIVLINSGGGTAEAVRIQSVSEGPDGLASIRVSTANNHAVSETVDGLGSFRAYFTATHTAGQTLTTNKFRSTLTFATGLGNLSLVGALSLATSSNRPIQDDDEIHISLRIDNPSRLLEARFMFDVDANVNDFTRNYYYYAISQNALTQALQNTVTTATAQSRIRQQQQLDQPVVLPDPDFIRYRNIMGRQIGRTYESGFEEPVFPTYEDWRIGQGLPDIPTTTAPTTETTAGDNQWTEVVFKVRDLLANRVGADMSRTLKNVAAIRIQFQITADIVVDVDAWWIGGTYGPDASGGSLYQYCYVGRNKATGAMSNPSPPMRSGIEPHRQRVSGTLAQHPDPQVDVLDVYRIGGSLNVWHYVTTVANSATPTFTDDFPDDVVTVNPGLEEDNYQPFLSTDVPRAGQCNAYGTKIRWRSGDIFNSSWGRNSLILVNGVPYTLYTQPIVTALTVTGATNASPIVITTSAVHGLNSGDGIRIAGVGGNASANGDWVVTVVSSTTFSLNGSAGVGAYTSGGTATKYDLETNENVGNLSNVSFELAAALLLGQPLPVMWGPYGGGLGGVFMFACGDTRLPGVLFITKGNNPDAAFYRLEITSGSEVLVNGCIYDGRCYVFSTERMYAVEPINGGQDWVAREVANSIGLYARWGLCVGERIYFIGRDGIYQSEGGQPQSLTDDDLYNLFPREAGSSVIGSESLYGLVPPDWFTPQLMRLDYTKNTLFWNYKSAGNYYNLVYDLLARRWFRDTYAATEIVTHYTLEGGTRPTAGGVNGRYYLLGGNTSDAGAAFSSQVTTGFEDLGDPRGEKQWMEVYLDYDADVMAEAIAVRVFLNNDPATVIETFTPTVATTREPVILSLNGGQGYLARSVGIDIQWSDAVISLFEYHYSYYVKGERSTLRFTDWHDLGYLGDKRIPVFTIRSDTFGQSKTVELEYDGGSSAGSYTMNHDGDRATAFALPTPVVAKLVRFTTADLEPWILYDAEFDFERYPELLAIVPDYVDGGTPEPKWLQGFKVEADTNGEFVTLRLDCDETIGVQTFSFTHNGKQVSEFSLTTPVICKVFRLVPADALSALRLFQIEWIFKMEPPRTQNWIAQPTTFGRDGFKTLDPTAYITHRSNVNLTLTITVDGVDNSFTIPHGTGEMVETRVVLNVLKGKVFQSKVTSAGVFRLYGGACVLTARPWGRSDETPWRPFGAPHGEGAEI